MSMASNAKTERGNDDDDDDEMPLLFMDGLPSSFQSNAQLAALVTLMPSDDDHDETNDQSDDATRAGKCRSAARRQRRTTARKARVPYARADGVATRAYDNDADEQEPTNTNKNKKRTTGAQELSLYLSMFKVSNE